MTLMKSTFSGLYLIPFDSLNYWRTQARSSCAQSVAYWPALFFVSQTSVQFIYFNFLLSFAISELFEFPISELITREMAIRAAFVHGSVPRVLSPAEDD